MQGHHGVPLTSFTNTENNPKQRIQQSHSNQNFSPNHINQDFSNQEFDHRDAQKAPNKQMRGYQNMMGPGQNRLPLSNSMANMASGPMTGGPMTDFDLMHM